ncbi:MAG: hypothetical protein SO116_08695 [Treponema sp.]|nr:hypothetical protein [Treponema sp.]
MEKHFSRKVSFLTAIVVFITAIFSCELGLGSSVDTQAPVIKITSPSSSEVYKQNIEVNGSWADDKGVVKIELSVTDTDSDKLMTAEKKLANIDENKSWNYTLYSTNSVDVPENAVVLPDGKYSVDATAYDSSGHSSGTSSRSFEVDGTAPVVVLSRPNLDYASYGRYVSIVGIISDDHSIKNMHIDVYDEAGELIKLAKSDFSVEDPSEVNVKIAQFYPKSEAGSLTGDTLLIYENYVNLYGTEDNESFDTTKKYTAVISVTDKAGNVSNKSYVKSELSEVIKKATGTTESPESTVLKSILNGSYSSETGIYNDAQVKQIKSILKGTIYDTEDECYDENLSVYNYLADETTKLSFSINSKANPTYEISSFKVDDGKFKENTKEGTLNIKLSMGLDSREIEISSLTAKITQVDDTGSPVKNGTVIDVDGYHIKDNAGQPVAEKSGYTDGSEVFSINLGDFGSELSSGAYYIVEVSGHDEDQNELIPKSDSSGSSYKYGFYIQSSTNTTEVSLASEYTDMDYVKAVDYENGIVKVLLEDSEDAELSVEAYVYIKDKIYSKKGELATSEVEKEEYKVRPKLTDGENVLDESLSDGSKFSGHTNYVLEIPVNLKDYMSSNSSDNYTVAIRVIASKKADGTTLKGYGYYFIYADNKAPELKFTNEELANYSNGSSLTITEKTKTVNETSAGTYIYTINGKWSDLSGSGTSQILYSLDSTEKGTGTWKTLDTSEAPEGVQSLTNWGKELDISSFEGTGKKISFYATDQVGNETEVYTFTNITYDFAMPAVKVTSPSSIESYYSYNASELSLVITSTDSNGISGTEIVCEKDGAEISSGTNGYTLEQEAVFVDNDTNLSTQVSTLTFKRNGSYDGKYKVTALASDIADRKTNVSDGVSFEITIDGTKPEFNADKGLKIKSSDYSESAYYKDTTLKIEGSFKEVTSGLDTLYYWIGYPGRSTVPSDLTASGGHDGEVSFASTSKGEEIAFSITPTEFAEDTSTSSNTLYFQAKDKAGNLSEKKSFTIHVDQTAPEFSCAYYTYDDKGYSNAAGNVLTSGKKDITVYGSVSDSASGIRSLTFKLDGNEITPSSLTYTTSSTQIDDSTCLSSAEKFAEWISPTDGSSAPVFEALSDSNRKNVTIWKAVISKTAFASGGALRITSTDMAGNNNEDQSFTFTVDSTSPEVKYSLSDNSDVNKTIVLSGTASDDKMLSSLSSVAYSTSTGSSKTWTQLDVALDGLYSWKTGEINTYDLFPETGTTPQTVYFKVTANDTAGNESSEYLTVNVDQNSDRPKVSLSNISLGDSMSGENYVWLKNQTVIIGTASDDDGINKFEISLDGTHWDVVTLTNGSWSYELQNFFTTSNGYAESDINTDDKKETLANGKQTIYFRVTDSESTQFVSKNTSDISSVYLVDGSNIYGSTSKKDSVVYVQVDTILPEVILKGAKLAASSNWTTSYSTVNVGGNNLSFELKFSASDANGINGSTISGSAEFSYTENGTAKKVIVENPVVTTVTENGETNYITKFTLPETGSNSKETLSGNSGSVNIKITVKDNAGNSSSQTATIAYDFAAPTVTLNNPSSTQISSGDVTAYGNITESSTTYYALSPSSSAVGTKVTSWVDEDGNAGTYKAGVSNATINVTPEWTEFDSATSWYLYFDGDIDNKTGGKHIETLNQHLIDWGITYAANDGTDTIVNGFTTVVKIFLHIKAVDGAGNEKLSCFPILVDPQGDRPSVTIDYPETSGTTLSGNVTLRGSASDPNGSVKTVWVQLVSEKDHTSDFNSIVSYTDGTISSATVVSSLTPTQADIQSWIDNGYEVYDFTNYTDSSVKLTSAPSSNFGNYGIKAIFSGSSWNLKINGNGEYNPSSGTNNVAFAVYARDNSNKLSRMAAQINKFDADNPALSGLYLVQSDSDEVGASITASREYTEDMWVKDEWYLTGTLTDKDLISSLTIGNAAASISGSTVTITGTDAAKLKVTVSDKTAKFKFKLGTGGSGEVGNVTLEIDAADGASTAHHFKDTYSINYDNVNPEHITSGDYYNISSEIKQTNNWYTFGSQVTEKTQASQNQSGFDYLTFSFKREFSDGKTVVYDPMLDRSASAIVVSPTTDANYTATTQSEGMYWISQSVTYDSLGNITLSSENPHIHPGGLCKINGTNYFITSVEGTSVRISGSLLADSDSVSGTAYFALALVVNNTVAEGSKGELQTSSGYGYGYYESPSNDDGDRMIESVSKSGTTWTWEANICSKNIPDGPVTLTYTAFDQAGNYATQSTTGNICNNAPRLAGVKIGTDSNGNGKIDEVTNAQGKVTYSEWHTAYSGMYSTYNKAVSSLVITDEDNDAKGYVTLNGYTQIVPEILGGNNEIYYQYAYGSSKSASETAAMNNVTTPLVATENYQSENTLALSNGIELSTGDILRLNISDTSVNSPAWFTINLWDKTEATQVFATSQKAVIQLAAGINISDTTVPEVSISEPSAVEGKGHVEISADWKGTSSYNSSATSGQYDGDTKVSGVVSYSGTAKDNSILSGLYFAIPSYSTKLSAFKASADKTVTISGKSVSFYKLASFDSASSTWTTYGTLEDNGWLVSITNESFADGHSVDFELKLNTALCNTVAANDVKVYVIAEDIGKPAISSNSVSNGLYTYTITSTSNKSDNASYQADIVPYVTSIERTSAVSLGTMNRSNLGNYPVAEGETLTVYGYNLGTGSSGGSWVVKNSAGTTHATGTNESVGASYTSVAAGSGSYANNDYFTLTAPTYSGNFSVTVNSIESLNNANNNNAEYNVEKLKMSGVSMEYTANDDRYFSVWNLGNCFKDTSEETEFKHPVMTADNNGQLYASWGNPSNGIIQFSYGLNQVSTPIYHCYDQPAEYTSVSIDKTGNTGASVLYFGEHQGKSGSFSSTGFSSSMVIGGAFVTQIKQSDINSKTTYTGTTDVVDGNPTMYLDKYNTSGFYNLCNYDMIRRMGSFSNPGTARSGNYLHNIWYDSSSLSLRYSVVNVGESNIIDNYKNNGIAVAGWVVIDGGYTGQDRTHNWTKNGTSGNTYNRIISGNGDHSINGTSNYTEFDTDIFLARNASNNPTVFTKSPYISNNASSTQLVTAGTLWKEAPAAGDTITLLHTEGGNYQLALRQVTSYSNKTIGWETAVPFTYDSANVYKGPLNVVGVAANAFDTLNSTGVHKGNSGSSAAIDVTASGYPVIAYFDDASATLRVAYADSVEPKLSSNWTRVETSIGCSGEVSLKVDGANNLHIMYNNEDGVMCYVKGTVTLSGSAISSIAFSDEEEIDDAGSLAYGAISVIYNGSSYIPTMTYINKANSVNAIKYAQRSSADENGKWNFMIIPSLGTGHYALKENKLSLESSNNWSGTGAVLQNQFDTTQPKTATPATVDSVIAYKTSTAFETAYLKKE